ncbi:MAG: winged helix-turn-helix domain-containing protein [Alphaproteobacteria bacterium]|nr:winged helix-turn-helix domain-containing protein [Alphaproteobacteria bacterium]
MFTGIQIFSSDPIWRQIFSDLNATVHEKPSISVINFDDLSVPPSVGLLELKSLILDAADIGRVLYEIFGKNVSLPQIQSQLLVLLYKSGGMTANQLKHALGYAPDAATHTVDTAIYQLRKTYGHNFIRNTKGVYSIGEL